MTNVDKTLPNKEDITLQLDTTGKKTLVAILQADTMTGAANLLSISRNALYERIAKYNLRSFLDEFPQQALDELKKAAPAAAIAMITTLNDRNQRLEASKEILDRVGVGKSTASNDNLKRRVIAEEFFE